MVPMWSRAWRFASVYAYAIVDIALLILWFAASVAVDVWNGRSTGEDNSNNVERSCTGGSSTRCGVSKAAVGFGFIITLSFCITATFAINAVRTFKRTGQTSHSTTIPLQGTMNADAGYAKEAWRTSAEDIESQSVDHNNGGFNHDEHFESGSEQRDLFAAR
jgi:hypothetical protein